MKAEDSLVGRKTTLTFGHGTSSSVSPDWGAPTAFPWASQEALVVKNLPASAGEETRVPSLGPEDSHGEGPGNPLQYSCLENSMDGGAWQATVHGVAFNLDRFNCGLPVWVGPGQLDSLSPQ